MNITETLLSFTLIGVEWVLWLLIGISLISFAIIIERSVYFLMNRTSSDSLIERLNHYLRDDKCDEAIQYLKDNPSFEAEVVRAGIESLDRGFEYAGDVITSKLLTEQKKLTKGLVFLATMGNNAPFIGLFGTVLGIVRAFNDLSLSTDAGASAVMSGISEALVATAVGLFVAIPAVLAYNFFQTRVKTVLTHTEAVKTLVLAQLRKT